MLYRLLYSLLLFQCCAVAGAGLRGQCEGALGENIFTDGDFGSGAPVTRQDDPGIAPGFIYQRNPPPSDGLYTITNNTGGWGSTFGNWDSFRDNSDDPNGYMMVVNAAFDPGEFYEQRVTGLCGNTEYQVSLDIRNIITRGANFILPNVSFLVDNDELASTGNVPENQQWNTYLFSFTTGPDQTVATLSLRNNAPGGIGNDLAIDNIQFRACGPEARVEGREVIRICEDGEPLTLTAEVIGDQYGDAPAFQWQQSFDEGATYENVPGADSRQLEVSGLLAGTYYYRYRLAASAPNLTNGKCRVLSNVKVVEVVPKLFVGVDTICRGVPYVVGEVSYTESTVIRDTLLSSLGCDSIIDLSLTVVPDTEPVATFVTTDPTCFNGSDGSFALTDVMGGAGPFSLFLGDTLTTGSFNGGLGNGAYRFRVVDRFGCSDEGEVVLTAPDEFTIDLGPDVTVNLGEEVRLGYRASGPIETVTSDPPGLLDSLGGGSETVLLPTNSLHLRVFAQDTSGCMAADSVMVTVIKNRDVYVPTAFSPNNDGANDLFTVFSDARRVTAVSYLRVYNRWGGLAYEAATTPVNDQTIGWDGQLPNRTPAEPGVYTYVSEVVFLDGETRLLSGTVTLLR